jgi:hypothetical protein
VCIEVHSHKLALAIELHYQDIEVAGVSRIHKLVQPGVQLFNRSGKKLVEGKILVAFALCIKLGKALTWYYIPFETADLTLVQILLAMLIACTYVST